MYNLFGKRIIDFIISGVALIVLLPLFVIISILIVIDDPGPIFYAGPRIGRNSKKLNMLKFRSMKVNAPDIRNEDGSTFNSKDDPRVTKVGRILRETSLDELPQLINVFIGQMSIVGPRASTWDVLDTYKEDEIDKMKVRPGITGYCQAYFRNSVSAREKRVKDAWYANNMSFVLDVKIIVKTIKTVVFRESLYTK